MVVCEEMFIWSKLGQNPSEIHVGTFARIKNLIWDQLQATKAEIIQSSAIFSCLCKTEGLKGISNALNKVLYLASAMEYADSDNKILFTGIPLRW